MKNTLKFAVVAATMLATLVAQAATGRILGYRVERGANGGGGVAAMTQADGNLHRVWSTNEHPKIDWHVIVGELGNPTLVRNMVVTVRGSKLGTSNLGLWMYDYVAFKWVYVSTVPLPNVGLANTSINVTSVPSRFVQFNGQCKLRFISTGPVTMIVDRISVTTS